MLVLMDGIILLKIGTQFNQQYHKIIYFSHNMEHLIVIFQHVTDKIVYLILIIINNLQQSMERQDL